MLTFHASDPGPIPGQCKFCSLFQNVGFNFSISCEIPQHLCWKLASISVRKVSEKSWAKYYSSWRYGFWQIFSQFATVLVNILLYEKNFKSLTQKDNCWKFVSRKKGMVTILSSIGRALENIDFSGTDPPKAASYCQFSYREILAKSWWIDSLFHWS